MIITAKYASTCNNCGAFIKPGDRINWERGTRPTHATCPATGNGQASMADRRANFEAAHPNIASWRERRRQERRAVSNQRQSLGGSYRNAFGRIREYNMDIDEARDRERERDEAEYQQGLADGERYHAEVKAYGRAMADRFAMEDEMTRFWKNGEDY